MHSRRQNDGFTLTAPLLLKYSYSHEVQLQLGGNTLTALRTQTRSTYFDNVVGTLKVHLVDQSAKRPALALSGGLSVPAAAATGYVRAYNGIFTAYVTKDLGPLHLDLNAGVNALAFDKVATGQGMVALSASAELTDDFGGLLEGYFFSEALPYALHDGGILFALTHSPAPWIVFDVGGDISFYPSTRNFTAFVGTTFIPVTFGKHDH
jgi:hypothetical protein